MTVKIFCSQFLFFSLLFCFVAKGQTQISGKVTDSESGEAIPMANVFFNGTTIGTSSDFDGYFTISTKEKFDTLVISYIGYKTRKKVVEFGKKQVINFQLESDAQMMREVVISDKYENPAWEIIRKVVDNKANNDYDKLSAYQYESYNKIELAIDGITDKFKKKKFVQEILAVIDSAKAVAGEDGKPMLPIFVSEALSNFYYRKNPVAKHESIIKTQQKGLFLDDASFVNQVIGNTFLQYNFYRNNVEILQKSFVSPIADSWRLFYDYELVKEGVLVSGVKCSQIEFKPKQKQDLAFEGTMWITEKDFALKQIDVTVGKEVNLNFVEKIKIQQELDMTISEKDSVWMPVKSRVVLKIGQIKDDWAGMLAKFYTSNKNIVINQPQKLKFYEEPIKLLEDAQVSDQNYWQKVRHDSLSREEVALQNMIDTIKNLPTIRTYAEIADILIQGFKKVGPIDIGSYAYLYANNNIEGNRIRLRFRTNVDFSKKFTLWGYAAYGTLDKQWKYGGGLQYIVSRKPWTEININHKYDINQVALTSESLRIAGNDLFLASTNWGDIKRNRPFMQRESEASFQTDIIKGFTQKIAIRHQDFDPLYNFEYFQTDEIRKSRFTNVELILESRISFRERLLQNGNRRVNVGGARRPIITLRYAKGLNNFLGGELNYDKFSFNLEHFFLPGVLGRTQYIISAGYTPSLLPYPLLETHLGNQTYFFNSLAFNQMRYFEFVSDRFVSLRVEHNFEGLLFNRIPLLKKLQWRLFTTGAALFGEASQANKALIPTTDLQGNPVLGFGSLNAETPYTEVGYGISNIFRFLRVHAIHRLTYLDNPGIERFSVKASVQFRF